MNASKAKSTQKTSANSKIIQITYGMITVAAIVFILYLGFQFGVWLK